MKAVYTRCAIGLVVLFALGHSALGVATIDNISISQADWLNSDGAVISQNSVWGRMDMDVHPDPTNIYYLNVSATIPSMPTTWIIWNVPVFPSDSTSPIRQSVDIDLTDLGLAPGDDLTDIDIAYSITPDVLQVMPAATPELYDVGDVIYQASGAKIGPPLLNVGAPMGVKATAAVTDAILHNGVGSVQEEKNCCLAGAFARSLDWLNKHYKLGSGNSAQDFYTDLRKQKVSSSETTYEQDIVAKHKYLLKLSPGATTKILDVAGIVDDNSTPGIPQQTGKDVVDWLYREMKTEDVELHYDKHMITLTGIYKQGGSIYVKYRDDEKQGDDAKGDKAEKTARLYKQNGDYYFRRKPDGSGITVKVLVSESVSPRVFQVLPGRSLDPGHTLQAGRNTALGNDPITAVPGVLKIVPGTRYDAAGNPIPGTEWSNYVSASGLVPYRVKSVYLKKDTPQFIQCAEVFPSKTVLQRGTASIRLWWPLMYEAPGTTWTLWVLYATESPIELPHESQPGILHTEEWKWTLDTDIEHMKLFLDLIHETPWGLSATPQLSDEALYVQLRSVLDEVRIAMENHDWIAACDWLLEWEDQVIDACIATPPALPDPTGPGTGIAMSWEKPVCCKLLVDAEYIGAKYNIFTPVKR